MIRFLVLAAVLLAAGTAFLLWPLLRRSAGARGSADAGVVALFRDRLRELDAERNAGSIAPEQAAAARQELQRELLEAVEASEAGAADPAPARWTALGVGLLVLLLPIGLYAVLGNPELLIPGHALVAQGEAAGSGAARPLTSAQVQRMISELQTALQKNPTDLQGWVMLARAYSYEHQYSDAMRAYVQAVALRPKDARLLADAADAMAMASGRRLDGEPMKLIERALQIDPDEVKALALAGTWAFERKDYARAIDNWEHAIRVAPQDAELARNLHAGVEEARQLLAGNPAKAGGAAQPEAGPASAAARVRGKVTIAPALAARVRPGDTLFVFARAAQGPRIPLAMIQRDARQLPLEFELDDSTAMTEELRLSRHSPVVIGARVSRSGEAIAATGDLQGFSGPVAVGSTGVVVSIDQVVP